MERQDSRLMSVSSDLVREHLVMAIHRAVHARLAKGLGADTEATLASSSKRLLGDGPDRSAIERAGVLAKMGYLTRIVEREMFAPAQQPIDWLAEALRERLVAAPQTSTDGPEALAVELVESEPEGRPDPTSGAPSWRVPGPGGHVRHYVAQAAIAEPIAAAATVPEPESDPATLKRCWLLGFFLSCCEEARSAGGETPVR